MSRHSVNAARGAEHAPAERCAGAPHVAENAAATGAVANAMREGTFVVDLISCEQRPAVLAGGVVYVIGSKASPALEPPASRTLPAPKFYRGCNKELAITPWRLRKFAEHGHWPVRCYVCDAKRAAAFQPVAPAEAEGLPSVGGRPLTRRSELELIQSHMAQKPVLRGEVGCACVEREVSVERRGMGERGCARRLGGWVWV